MNRLLDIGFQTVGRWIHNNDSGLEFELLKELPHENTLYAFVADGEVRYVGKTTKTLHGRLRSYRHPGTSQRTNVRNNAAITALLSEGITVEILALPDPGHHRFGPFHLNLAAGLEDSIIEQLNPPWNGAKTSELAKEAIGDVLETLTKEPTPEVGRFTFTLQRTYRKTGFFNVGVSAQQWIGADAATIEIHCGDDPKPIMGSINRRANLNNTPRIMGGPKLREWFQANFAEMDKITAMALSPTCIRLTTELNCGFDPTL